jgi:hypothetical protein
VISFFGRGESAFARPDQRHIVYLLPGRDSLFLFEQLDQPLNEPCRIIRRQQSDLIDNDFKLVGGHNQSP